MNIINKVVSSLQGICISFVGLCYQKYNTCMLLIKCGSAVK